MKVHRDSVTKIVKILNINNSNEFGLCSKSPKLKRSTTISNKALKGRHYEFLLKMEKQWTQTDLDTDENTLHDGYCEVFFSQETLWGLYKTHLRLHCGITHIQLWIYWELCSFLFLFRLLIGIYPQKQIFSIIQSHLLFIKYLYTQYFLQIWQASVN